MKVFKHYPKRNNALFDYWFDERRQRHKFYEEQSYAAFRMIVNTAKIKGYAFKTYPMVKCVYFTDKQQYKDMLDIVPKRWVDLNSLDYETPLS